MGDDGWLAAHALQLVLATFALAQAEADRYAKTAATLHTYMSLRSERALPFTPPPLIRTPQLRDCASVSPCHAPSNTGYQAHRASACHRRIHVRHRAR